MRITTLQGVVGGLLPVIKVINDMTRRDAETLVEREDMTSRQLRAMKRLLEYEDGPIGMNSDDAYMMRNKIISGQVREVEEFLDFCEDYGQHDIAKLLEDPELNKKLPKGFWEDISIQFIDAMGYSELADRLWKRRRATWTKDTKDIKV